MTAFIETFLMPGEIMMDFILLLFGFSGVEIGLALYRVGAAFASWIIWSVAIRFTWKLTLHIFGIQPFSGGQR